MRFPSTVLRPAMGRISRDFSPLKIFSSHFSCTTMMRSFERILRCSVCCNVNCSVCCSVCAGWEARGTRLLRRRRGGGRRELRAGNGRAARGRGAHLESANTMGLQLASEYNIYVIIATLLHTKYVLKYMLSTLLVCMLVNRVEPPSWDGSPQFPAVDEPQGRQATDALAFSVAAVLLLAVVPITWNRRRGLTFERGGVETRPVRTSNF